MAAERARPTAALPEAALRGCRVVDALLPTAAALAAAAICRAPWRSALLVAAVVTTAGAFASRVLHQYHPQSGRAYLGDVALTLVFATCALAPAWLLARAGALPGVATGYATTLAALLVPAAVAVRGAFVGRLLASGGPASQILVVGINPLGRITGNELIANGRRSEVIGYLRFDDEQPHDRLRAPLLGTTADLESVLRERVIDDVYVARTADHDPTPLQAVLHTCERLGIPFALPAVAYRVTRARPTSTRGIEDGYLHFQSVPSKPVQQALKRLIDIVVSAAALAVLSPLLLGVALVIRVSSPGAILFRQPRVGLHGRAFDMLKFRSMVVDAERLKEKLLDRNEQRGPVFKMKRDPRVTAVGRFIRRFSIDELPQFVNVLRGDMSIVGPRPPLPEEVARYEAWQRRRLSVRPGLTCVWQVSGRNEISFQDWMMLDLRYIDHWSLLTDLSLIARTVPVVLTGKGAS